MVVERMNEASCGLQGNLISNVLQGQPYGTGEMQSLIFKRIMCVSLDLRGSYIYTICYSYYSLQFIL